MLKKVKTIFGILDVRPLFGICPLLGNYVILVVYLSDTTTPLKHLNYIVYIVDSSQ